MLLNPQRFGLTRYKESLPNLISKSQGQSTILDLNRDGTSILQERVKHALRRNLIAAERKRKPKKVRNVRYVIHVEKRVPEGLSHQELVDYIKNL